MDLAAEVGDFKGGGGIVVYVGAVLGSRDRGNIPEALGLNKAVE